MEPAREHDSGGPISIVAGDQMTPAYEHASVADAMRPGVFTCSDQTPLIGVGRIMATHHVHSVVVMGRALANGGGLTDRAWGIVTDVDLMRVADEAEGLAAAYIATPDVRTVTPGTPLQDAAHLMADHRISHLLVVDPESNQPIGVLSSLDIIGNLAWARG
jgi:CBS domain-containing protein